MICTGPWRDSKAILSQPSLRGALATKQSSTFSSHWIASLRSTFIVGFPGETESDFQYLLDWLEEAQIDRVGAFKYESVAGATSNAIANAVPEEIKQQRWNALMERQQKISARRLKRKVGTRQQIIIDEVGPTVSKGRSKADAPDIDGSVYITARRPLKVGEIVTAKIERADAYDLHGTVAGF